MQVGGPGWAYKVLAAPAAMLLSGAGAGLAGGEQGADCCSGLQVTEPPPLGAPENVACLCLPTASPARAPARVNSQQVRRAAAGSRLGGGREWGSAAGQSSAGQVGSKFY